jgi:hypothetical protein
MSTYSINEICYRCVHDRGFRAAMKADPRAAIADLDLTDEERRAVLGGEVGLLYRMGANTYLLGHLMRYELLGITLPLYQERLFAAAKGS